MGQDEAIPWVHNTWPRTQGNSEKTGWCKFENILNYNSIKIGIKIEENS